MRPKGINWAEIAPKYDALGRGNTAGKQALADEYGIDSVSALATGLSAWRKKRVGTAETVQNGDTAPVQSLDPDTGQRLMRLEAAVRWNLWINAAIKDAVAKAAAERDMAPSILVETWLWRSLHSTSV